MAIGTEDRVLDGLQLAEWTSRLVQIPSVNPAQAGPRAGEPGEGRLADRVGEWFADLGGQVERHEVLPGRPNVYGIWPGRDSRWAVVDVHIDTVGVEQMTDDPFSGRIAAGRVWGRGASDTKATLGVCLALLQQMRVDQRRPALNLLIAATVDEEVNAQGAPAFAQWMRNRDLTPDQMIVAEPTRCAAIVAHKGVLRITYRVLGKPAHSAQPQLGQNAITAAAGLCQALVDEHQRLQSDPLLARRGPTYPGAPTLTVTMISGGRGHNVVPDCCDVTVDRRLSPGESGEAEQSRLIELGRRAVALPIEVELHKRIEPFDQSPEAPWVRQLEAWTGQELSSAPYCTNAWAYRGLARECVVLGPGSIDQAHGVEEWIEISELQRLAELYRRWWDV